MRVLLTVATLSGAISGSAALSAGGGKRFPLAVDGAEPLDLPRFGRLSPRLSELQATLSPARGKASRCTPCSGAPQTQAEGRP